MRRRLFGVLAALALAALGTLVLVGYVRGAEQRALEGQRTVDVLVVEEPIAQGTPANELQGKVRTEQVPAKVQAAGAVATLADLEGQVAVVDLVPGEQVVSTRFAAPEALEEERRVQVPDGLLQVTISLTPERAIGGQPRPGSTVGVIASFTVQASGEAEPGEGGSSSTGAATHLILHKVLVSNVQAERLPQPAEADSGDDSNAPELAPTGNFLITLAVDAPSAERIVFAAEHGSLWLALEPEDAPETGTRIQSPATIYQGQARIQTPATIHQEQE
ncbi:MAG: Flp pilus assembly protein CpaB [Acidimicrobiia bacterium]